MAVNYYEELNLSKDDSLEEINHTLNQLESTWKRREITSPEKATKMLALIIDARAVFATEQSRSEYNSSLMARQENVVQSPSEQFEKAWAEVERFFDNKQWDLSKMAIEKALPLMDAAGLDVERTERVYAIAQEIYLQNVQFEQAIDFTNRHISIRPDSGVPYYNKQIVLFKYIEYLQRQNLDATQYINTYRTTCQVWAKTTKERSDYLSASDALYFLSASYINYNPKDFDFAEKLAQEALSFNPDHSGAKEVIKWLDQPKRVSLEDLRNYDQEPSPLEQDILDLAHQIATSGLQPETSEGWSMAKKTYFGEYNPNGDGFDEENLRTFAYYLSPEGKFMCNEKREIEYFKQGQRPITANEESKYECDLLEIMRELDFDGYISYNSGSSWHEHGESVKYIGYQEPSALRNNGTLRITRKARKKGVELYKKLKSIVDSAAAYIEECNRINAAFYGEWESVKQAISEKYSAQREKLVQERDLQIELARSTESQRQNIQSQIQSSRNEMASLGFFSVKRKKELQASIAQLERQVWQMPTVDSVKSAYQERIDDLICQESAELQRTEQELKSKYPLPKR